MNWVVIFNRLFELIDTDGTPDYFSGPRFLRKVREVDPYGVGALLTNTYMRRN